MKLLVFGKVTSTSLFLFLTIFFIAISYNSIFAETSNKAIDLINKERINRNLKIIKIDEKLCILAKMLADDNEKAYPDKIDAGSKKYRDILKDYPVYVTGVITTNDMLVDVLKKSKSPLPKYTDEQISKTVIDGGQAVNSEITRGCTAISSGNIGYKPFSIFIGAYKTEDLGVIARIKLFFQGLFSVFNK